MTFIRRGILCPTLAAAFLWSGVPASGEVTDKEKRKIIRSNYVTPSPKDNSHYKFDYDGKPLYKENKKKEKGRKAKKKKKSKKNKWRPRPGKRSPKKAARPPASDDDVDDSADKMEPGGELPSREPETTASGEEKKDGEGFNYGGVKVDGGPKFGGIPPTGQ